MRTTSTAHRCATPDCLRYCEGRAVYCTLCIAERRRASSEKYYNNAVRPHTPPEKRRFHGRNAEGKNPERRSHRTVESLCLLCGTHHKDVTLMNGLPAKGNRLLCRVCEETLLANHLYEGALKVFVNGPITKKGPSGHPRINLFWREWERMKASRAAGYEYIATWQESKGSPPAVIIDDLLELLSSYILTCPSADTILPIIQDARGLCFMEAPDVALETALTIYLALTFVIRLSPLRIIEFDGNEQFMRIRADLEEIMHGAVTDEDWSVLRRRYFTVKESSIYESLAQEFVIKGTAIVYRGKNTVFDEEIFKTFRGPFAFVYSALREDEDVRGLIGYRHIPYIRDEEQEATDENID